MVEMEKRALSHSVPVKVMRDLSTSIHRSAEARSWGVAGTISTLSLREVLCVSKAVLLRLLELLWWAQAGPLWHTHMLCTWGHGPGRCRLP
jgi:hypothetical protein